MGLTRTTFLSVPPPTGEALIGHAWTRTHANVGVARHVMWGHPWAHPGLRKAHKQGRGLKPTAKPPGKHRPPDSPARGQSDDRVSVCDPRVHTLVFPAASGEALTRALFPDALVDSALWLVADGASELETRGDGRCFLPWRRPVGSAASIPVEFLRGRPPSQGARVTSWHRVAASSASVTPRWLTGTRTQRPLKAAGTALVTSQPSHLTPSEGWGHLGSPPALQPRLPPPARGPTPTPPDGRVWTGPVSGVPGCVCVDDGRCHSPALSPQV